MRAGQMTSTVMLTVMGAAVLLAGPPTRSISATAEFREEAGDAVTASATMAGAIVSGTYSARVTPVAGVSLDLSLGPLSEGSRECAVDGVLAGCNPTGPFRNADPNEVLQLQLYDFDIKVKPILDNAPDFDDLPGGLTGMTCTGASSSSPALVNYTFWIGGEGHWGLNVNPRYNALAATVVRSTSTTWVVTATATADSHTGNAELVSFGHSAIRRKAGPSREGQYDLPFQMTILAPTAPPAPDCVP